MLLNIFILLFLTKICSAFNSSSNSNVGNISEKYKIFLPDECIKEEKCPLLILFHGQSQNNTIWDNLGLSKDMDDLIKTKQIQPFIVAMPIEENYLSDMYESDFDEIVFDKIIPDIYSNYSIKPGNKYLALGGISRGALWAQKIAFEHYGEIGQIDLISPPNNFFSLPKLNRLIIDSNVTNKIKIRIDIGNNDPYLRSCFDLITEFVNLKYPFDLCIDTGTHDIDFWKDHLKNNLLWVGKGFE